MYTHTHQDPKKKTIDFKPFDSLPDEIVLMILKQVGLKGLLTIEAVSNRFRAVASLLKVDDLTVNAKYYIVQDKNYNKHQHEFSNNPVLLAFKFTNELDSIRNSKHFPKYDSFAACLEAMQTMHGKRFIVVTENDRISGYFDAHNGKYHCLDQSDNISALLELLKFTGSAKHLLCLENTLFNDCESQDIQDNNKARKKLALRILKRYILEGIGQITSTEMLDKLQSAIDKHIDTDLKYLRRMRRVPLFAVYGDTYTWQEIKKVIETAENQLMAKSDEKKQAAEENIEQLAKSHRTMRM